MATVGDMGKYKFHIEIPNLQIRYILELLNLLIILYFAEKHFKVIKNNLLLKVLIIVIYAFIIVLIERT